MIELINCRYPGCKSKVAPIIEFRYVLCLDHDDVDTDRYDPAHRRVEEDE